MAVQSPPFALQNGSHSAALFRQAVSSAWRGVTGPGVGVVGAGDLATTAQSTPNMSVQVAAGRAWILGSQVASVSGGDWSPQAAYFGINDAPVTVTIAAADPTNPRIDVVYAAVQDSFYSGTTNALVVGVVTGTPAATPAAPSAPSNSLVLAQVAVAANATSIGSANISGAPLMLVTRGGVMPVPAGDATAGQYRGQLRDFPTGSSNGAGGVQRWSGSAWQAVGPLDFPAATIRQVTAQSGLAAGWQIITLDTVDVDTNGAYSAGAVGTTGARAFVVPAGQGGVYAIEGLVAWNANAGQVDARIIKNGAVVPATRGNGLTSAGGVNGVTTGRRLYQLAAGDYIQLQGYSAAAPWATFVPPSGDGGSWLSIDRIR